VDPPSRPAFLAVLTWSGSAIVNDIKGETAGFRAGIAACFCSTRPMAHSAAYVPLLEVRKGEWEVRGPASQSLCPILGVRSRCR
jgi:hypothetical protein